MTFDEWYKTECDFQDEVSTDELRYLWNVAHNEGYEDALKTVVPSLIDDGNDILYKDYQK